MQFLSFTRIYLINAYKVETERPKQVDIVLCTLHGYVFSEKYRILRGYQRNALFLWPTKAVYLTGIIFLVMNISKA